MTPSEAARLAAGLTRKRAAKALWIQESTLARLERTGNWSMYRAERAIALYRSCGVVTALEDYLPIRPPGGTQRSGSRRGEVK